jgi:HEPN domain-containing protein
MDKKEFALDWIRHAKSDLNTSKHMFTEISAWHCQQRAEKALKAFLIANDLDPPKIHNLDELAKFCQNIDTDFSEIRYDCQKLNPYGSAVRYPNELAVDETVVQAAIKRTRKVYDFCVAKINLLIQDGENKT